MSEVKDACEGLANALAEAKRLAPYFIEYIRLDARQKRERYVALVAEGFTEQQALYLCVHTGGV